MIIVYEISFINLSTVVPGLQDPGLVNIFCNKTRVL